MNIKILKIRKVVSNLAYIKNKHVRKGDVVIVKAGDYKGTISKVSQVIGGLFVRLQDIFKLKIKKNDQKKEETIKQHRKIHISNVMHYVESINKPSRIFYKLDENGKKSRFYKVNNERVPMNWIKLLKNENSINEENSSIISENNDIVDKIIDEEISKSENSKTDENNKK